MLAIIAIFSTLTSCTINSRGCFEDSWNSCVSGWSQFFAWIASDCCSDVCSAEFKFEGVNANIDCIKSGIILKETPNIFNDFISRTYIDDRPTGSSRLTTGSLVQHSPDGSRNINFLNCFRNMDEIRFNEMMKNPENQIFIFVCLKDSDCPPQAPNLPANFNATPSWKNVDFVQDGQGCKMVMTVSLEDVKPIEIICTNCCN